MLVLDVVEQFPRFQTRTQEFVADELAKWASWAIPILGGAIVSCIIRGLLSHSLESIVDETRADKTTFADFRSGRLRLDIGAFAARWGVGPLLGLLSVSDFRCSREGVHLRFGLSKQAARVIQLLKKSA